MTPTYSRYGDHNSYNRQLLEQTRSQGGNPYFIKYQEAMKNYHPKHEELDEYQTDSRGIPWSNELIVAMIKGYWHDALCKVLGHKHVTTEEYLTGAPIINGCGVWETRQVLHHNCLRCGDLLTPYEIQQLERRAWKRGNWRWSDK